MTFVSENAHLGSKIIDTVRQIIPETEIQSSEFAQLCVNIPNKNTNKLIDLFKILETNKTELGIKGIGLSCTTIEEVFLKQVLVQSIYYLV